MCLHLITCNPLRRGFGTCHISSCLISHILALTLYCEANWNPKYLNTYRAYILHLDPHCVAANHYSYGSCHPRCTLEVSDGTFGNFTTLAIAAVLQADSCVDLHGWKEGSEPPDCFRSSSYINLKHFI